VKSCIDYKVENIKLATAVKDRINHMINCLKIITTVKILTKSHDDKNITK